MNSFVQSANPATRLLRLEGAALMCAAAVLYMRSGAGIVWFGMLFLAPDISLFFYLVGARAGGVAYNIAHSTIGALILLSAGALSGRTGVVTVSLIWLCHIGFDRALGYGLKCGSFSDTHLGAIGRKARASAAETHAVAAGLGAAGPSPTP
ncbi:MAG: DUF4260 domain-containing protein [Alphaproteobacteria bacterium]|nr:DUF4260 domain-containing protein [Alphaproteobacteria bacterium]